MTLRPDNKKLVKQDEGLEFTSVGVTLANAVQGWRSADEPLGVHHFKVMVL